MIRLPESDSLWPWVRYFLEEHLPHHRGVSPHTVDGYRTTFRLLRRFLRLRSPSSRDVEVRLEDLQPPLLLEFLAWLEAPMGRGVSPETRNCRLAALRSLSRFLELHRGKEEGTQWRRLRQLPFKLTTRSAVDYLEPREVDRVLSEVPAHTRDGFRDLTILALLYNTGARAEEVASLRRSALMLEEPPAVRLTGKGRCERTCPLWTSTAALLRRYLQQYRRRGRAAHERFVFVNQRGERLTRFGIGRIVEKYLRKAALTTPSLRAKRLSTHSFRHSTAIALLEGGADINVIKAWLGHRSTRTTSRYLDMSLESCRQVLKRFLPPPVLGHMAEIDSMTLHPSSIPAESIETWLEQL